MTLQWRQANQHVQHLLDFIAQIDPFDPLGLLTDLLRELAWRAYELQVAQFPLNVLVMQMSIAGCDPR